MRFSLNMDRVANTNNIRRHMCTLTGSVADALVRLVPQYQQLMIAQLMASPCQSRALVDQFHLL
jgi:hypothetical protein